MLHTEQCRPPCEHYPHVIVTTIHYSALKNKKTINWSQWINNEIIINPPLPFPAMISLLVPVSFSALRHPLKIFFSYNWGCWKEVGSLAELRGTFVRAHEGLAYIKLYGTCTYLGMCTSRTDLGTHTSRTHLGTCTYWIGSVWYVHVPLNRPRYVHVPKTKFALKCT